MALPLDETFISTPAGINAKDTIPALDARWREDIDFVKYRPPEESLLTDIGEYETWLERLSFIDEDLTRVLRLPHDKFWCQVIFDASLHCCIDSYLKHAFRPHQKVVLELPEEARTTLQKVNRLVFMVCLRMATHKESKEHYITPHIFGEIIYENFIFDIPKLMDLCVVYRVGNGPLLSKMINNIFTQQSKYKEDLRAAVSTTLQVLDNMKAEQDAISKSSGCRDQPSLSRSSDVMLFLIDTSETLSAFVDIYPDAAVILAEEDFPIRLTGAYEWMYPMLNKSLKFAQSTTDETAIQHRTLFLKSLTGLISLFQKVVFKTCLQPILENSGSEETEACVDQFLYIMSAVLSHPKFLSHHEKMFPFSEMLDILSQSTNVVDVTTLEFIQKAINDVRIVDCGRIRRRRVAPSTGMSDTNLTSDSTLAAQDDGGAEASSQDPQLTPVQIDSLVTSIKDVLPHLGDGFLLHCLVTFNYNFEQVINAVLEDKLPQSLRQLDPSLPREKPLETEVEDQTTALTYRKNVYDDDEFDVFHRDNVDTSKIHRGKKENTIPFEDKEAIEQLRPLYNRYGSEFVESMYDKIDDYEDEYDDTYDSNEVGADDVDSAEETVKASHRFKVTRDEDSDEDTEEANRRKDDFVEDPAKIRERQAARWATKMGQRKPRIAQPAHDVKGVAKGQGQSSETVHNRAWKEKHKSTRVHHNRKALADKKRKV